jgi:hypothetical protein
MSDWRAELRARLEGMELAAAREAEIIDELTQHLTERELALLQSGVPRDEARRQVLDEIDDHVRLRRDLEHSAVRPLDPAPGSGGVSLRHVFHDIRYACRTLVRDRGYFVTAFLALAVGIGGTTAIFGDRRHPPAAHALSPRGSARRAGQREPGARDGARQYVIRGLHRLARAAGHLRRRCGLVARQLRHHRRR